MTDQGCNDLRLNILTELNLIRHLPHLQISNLRNRLYDFSDFEYSSPGYNKHKTWEGVEAVSECIDFLEVQMSLPTVTLHEGLSKAAEQYAIDFCNISKLGAMYQETLYGTLDQRLSKVIKYNKMAEECIDVGSFDAVDILTSLMIDDGNDERMHRKTIFNKDAKYIGIGCVPHKKFRVVTIIYLVG